MRPGRPVIRNLSGLGVDAPFPGIRVPLGKCHDGCKSECASFGSKISECMKRSKLRDMYFIAAKRFVGGYASTASQDIQSTISSFIRGEEGVEDGKDYDDACDDYDDDDDDDDDDDGKEV